MTVYSGNAGSVKVGANAVGKVTKFTVKQSAETIRTDAIGDAAKTYTIGKTEWEGSMDARLDSSDTGQSALTIGASVTVELYPDGNTAGRLKLSGSALVTGIDTAADMDDVNMRAFTIRGAGALTVGTAP